MSTQIAVKFQQDPQFSQRIMAMINAVEVAGTSLLQDFKKIKHLQISEKAPGDYVSRADLNSEKVLVRMLLKAFPDYGFLNEEAGEITGTNQEFRWIIDPLDGTANFLSGLPHWGISVALEQKLENGTTEVVASVIYDPLKAELFVAEKGNGACLNGHPITVSDQTKLIDSVLGTSMPTKGNAVGSESAIRYEKLAKQVGRVRAYGSATLDLCYIASGRFDLCHLDRKIKYWDMAAGELVVKEAGGMVTDLEGGNQHFEKGQILAANPVIHKLALEVLG